MRLSPDRLLQQSAGLVQVTARMSAAGLLDEIHVDPPGLVCFGGVGDPVPDRLVVVGPVQDRRDRLADEIARRLVSLALMGECGLPPDHERH